MKPITIDGCKFSLPEDWSELTEENCRTIIRATSKIKNKVQVQSSLVLDMLGLRVMPKRARVLDESKRKLRKAVESDPEGKRLYYIRHGITKVFLISAPDLAFLASALDWLFTAPKDGTVTLKSRIITNFIPVVRIGKRAYYGPESLFDGIKYGQFEEAEMAWAEFSEGNMAKARDAMAALYRLDCMPENERVAEQKRKDFAKISNEDLRLFSLYYEGAKKAITDYYIDIFGTPATESENPFAVAKPVSVQINESFVNMTNLLSKLDPTKIAGIRECYLYDAFNTLVAIKKTSSHEPEL